MADIFTIIGAVVIAAVSFRFVRFWLRIAKLYLIPRDQRQLLRSYGEWAIVTGCTDGLGREYALHLAKQGLSIVLVSRSADKLHTVAEEIATQSSGVKTKTVVADFTRLDVYDAIQQAIQDIDVGVLVNNVGFGEFDYEKPKIGDKPRQALMDTVICNCVPQTALSNIVLPKMAAKKRGLIINMSSASSLFYMPYMSVYGASKRFDWYLSDAMRLEYAEFGVDVQTVAPFYVTSKLSGLRRANFFIKTAASFVRSHLNTIGVDHFVHGCIAHEIESALMSVLLYLPTGLADFFILRRMKQTAAASVAAKKRREAAASKKQN